MKTFTGFSLALLLLCISIVYSKLPNENPISYNPVPVQSVFLQTNNINTVFSTDGIFNYDRVTFTSGEAGLIWPVTASSRRTIGYATGLWIGAKVGAQHELRLAAAFYASHYSPGNIPVIGQPSPSSVCSDPTWRAYQVALNDPSLVNGGNRNKIAGGRTYNINYDSWANWPVSKGAYYVEVNQIPGYQPSFDGDRPGIGHTTARPDEVIFMVYMDYTNCTNSIHTSEISLPGGTLPLGVEIHQTAFSFLSNGMNDMYFVKWKIINRSSLNWDSVYVGLTDDSDIGDGFDDAAGCDSTRNLGFIYNFDNSDPVYGEAPPALGYRILQSPLRFTGNPQDTARLPYGNYIGYQLTGMSGYNVFKNGGGTCEGDPNNAPAAYNFLSGKDGCGNILFNWVTNKQTRYKYSGNSVNRIGWYDSTANDRRQILTCGPFSMNSGSEQIILSGTVAGKGANNNLSVQKVISLSDSAQRYYYSSFMGTPLGVNSISTETPVNFLLSQNYPNPFNPKTKIKFQMPKSEFVKLIVYDIAGKQIAALVGEELNPGFYEVNWNAVNFPSGVYFYRLTAGDFTETKKMLLIK
jgi:hypothetical protein